MREGDDDAFVGDEILDVDLAFRRHDLRAPFGSILALNVAQLLLDDFEDARLFGEDVEQVFDRLEQAIVFLLDALALEAGELIEAQVENVADLLFGETISPIDDPRLIADQDSDLLDGFARPRERHQLALWHHRGRANRE